MEMIKDRKRLYEVLNNTGGTYSIPSPSLFKAFRTVSGGGFPSVPWDNAVFHEWMESHADELYYQRSGDKYITKLVQTYADQQVNGKLSDSSMNSLARDLIFMFNNKWIKEWNIWQRTYDPIENYDMTETMTDDETVRNYGRTDTRTDDLQHSISGTDTETRNLTEQDTQDLTETETKNLTETTTPNLTTTESEKINGFNSGSAVDSGKKTTTNTGSNGVTNTGTDTIKNTGTDTKTNTGTDTMQRSTTQNDTGTETHRLGGSDTQTRNYELTRSGNIGVTTTQQMLESEKELWLFDFFINIVFPDLDKIITLNVY